ncbi:MAG: hypothetical protein RL150_98 [Candidatus Parcubacteria bacterium]|jgi:hypothetical protein
MRYIIFFLILCFVLTPIAAGAYGFDNLDQPTIVDRGVRVEEALLDQVVYTAGDTAVLSFSVRNESDLVWTGMQYRVDVVGNLDETTGEPSTRFLLGEVSGLPVLVPGGVVPLSLRVPLPAYLGAGNIGLAVSVFGGDGSLIARDIVPLLVTGSVTPSITYVAQTQVDGEPFGLQAGPTVYAGEQVFFAISMRSSRGSYTLTPQVAVYEGEAPFGEPKTTYAGEAVPVQVGRSTEQRMRLPTFDGEAGTYTALISYTDTASTTYAGPFEVRYVVGGERPQLMYASPTALEVSAGDTFSVEVAYRVAPPNLSLEPEVDPAFQVGALEVLVSIVDANGLLVGESKVPFLPGKKTVRVPFVAPYYLYGMRIVTTLFENGVVVDVLDTYVPEEGVLVAGDGNGERALSVRERVVVVGVGALLTLVVVVAGVLFVRRKRRGA